MRHGVKKIKFKQGKDANEMLMRKLAVNFLTHGKLTTTKAKAKAVVSYLEKMLTKAKNESEASKNVLLKYFGNQPIVYRLFKEIGPMLRAKNSGYLKLTGMGQRLNDGSEMIKIEWSIPVVIDSPKKDLKSKTEKEEKTKEELKK